MNGTSERRPARRPKSMMHCNARPVLRPAFSFYQTREALVAHAHEIQSFSGHDETARANFAKLQSRSDFFDAHFVERALHQHAHHQSNHLVEEAIAVELDRDAGTFLSDTHRINCADRALFGLSPIRSEIGKIMSANKMFGGGFDSS